MSKQFIGTNEVPDIVSLYESGQSLYQIAGKTGIKVSTVRYKLLKLGVRLRTMNEGISLAAKQGRMGLKPGQERVWVSEEAKRGIVARYAKWAKTHAKGKSIKPNGYIEITIGENKGRGEHAIVAEKAIGRPVEKGEVVHHINGNRSDNRPENLMVMSRSEHTSLHMLAKHKTLLEAQNVQ